MTLVSTHGAVAPALPHGTPSSQDIYEIEYNPRINHRNITGFCIIFAFFVGGLITNAIIAAKIIALGPFYLPASVFLWALTFPCSDIAAEVYGRQYAHKMVMGGFIAYILMLLFMHAAIAMPAAPFWHGQEQFQSVLGSSTRVLIAAITSYAVVQFLDVHIYGYLKQKTKGRLLWLRNNGSTLISQTLANIIFLSIAFLGTVPMEKWISLFISNLSARYILLVLDTAIVYGAVYALYKIWPELRK